MQGGEIVVSMLEKYDVHIIFGVPGDTSLPLYDALKKTSSIKHVMCRDERSACYMADVYARVTGKPGVCEVPSGGGIMYSLPGTAEANDSCVPLVILSSDVSRREDERSALTALDQVSLLKPVSRWSYRPAYPEELPFALRKAFRAATSGKGGAAHISLAQNVLSASCGSEINKELYAEKSCSHYPAFRVKPEKEEVEKALSLLFAANKPLILAGGGVIRSGAAAALLEFAQLTSMPVVTTINGKGAITETSPLSLGVVGSNGAKESSNLAVSQADTLLCIGSKLNSSITVDGKLINHETRVIQVDIDPVQLGNNTRLAMGIWGDALLTLREMKDAALDITVPAAKNREWLDHMQKLLEKELSSAEDRPPHDKCLHPLALVKVLGNILPEDSYLVCDSGTPLPFFMAYYRPGLNGQRVIVPRAHGSLGYALGGALGAKLASPSSTVVGVFGDGSLGMVLGEMETVTRLGQPVIYVHFNNGSFGWIKALQKIFYDSRFFSVDFSQNINYADIARAHGMDAFTVSDTAGLEYALQKGIANEKPTFIDAHVPTAAECMPPVPPWILKEGGNI